MTGEGSRRLWAAMMLTINIDVCESILLGRPVLAGRLDSEALRRALRGGPLPDASAYIAIDTEHLDAVAEAGPFQLKGKKRTK